MKMFMKRLLPILSSSCILILTGIVCIQPVEVFALSHDYLAQNESSSDTGAVVPVPESAAAEATSPAAMAVPEKKAVPPVVEKKEKPKKNSCSSR